MHVLVEIRFLPLATHRYRAILPDTENLETQLSKVVSDLEALELERVERTSEQPPRLLITTPVSDSVKSPTIREDIFNCFSRNGFELEPRNKA